jgi:hypothetical protein
MYKLIEDIITHSIIGVQRIFDNAGIPFDTGNSDYQQFKKDLAEGASLKDAEGNDMTAEQITAFLGELK